jgi:endonuclease III
MVPADIRYDLHVAMIGHGRTVCRGSDHAAEHAY